MPPSAADPAASGAGAEAGGATVKRGDYLLHPEIVNDLRSGPVAKGFYYTVISVTKHGQHIKAQVRSSSLSPAHTVPPCCNANNFRECAHSLVSRPAPTRRRMRLPMISGRGRRSS